MFFWTIQDDHGFTRFFPRLRKGPGRSGRATCHAPGAPPTRRLPAGFAQGFGKKQDRLPGAGVGWFRAASLPEIWLSCVRSYRSAEALRHPEPWFAEWPGKPRSLTSFGMTKCVLSQAWNSLASGKRSLHLARLSARSSSILVSSQLRDMASSLTRR
jgi:hypothetical protein